MELFNSWLKTISILASLEHAAVFEQKVIKDCLCLMCCGYVSQTMFPGMSCDVILLIHGLAVNIFSQYAVP